MDLKDIVGVEMVNVRKRGSATVAITLNDPSTGRPGLTRYLNQRQALLLAVQIIDAAMEIEK